MSKKIRAKSFSRLTAALMLLVLLIGLAGCSSGSVEAPAASPEEVQPSEPERSAEEIAFQEGVYTVIDNIVPDNINGDKAACIIVPENVWETYVSLDAAPEELRTSDASQVRYIIRQYEYKEIVGQYTTGSAISGMAYQWRYVVEVEDLKLNGILDAAEFLGSEPPEVISQGDSPVGSLPDAEQINAWIIETINKGFVDKYPLLIKVPEGWGTPFVEYRDYMSLTSKWKTKQLIPDGEWYSIMLPSSVSELTVTTHPNTAGTEDYHVTQEDFRTYQKPGWIIVENLEGNAAYYSEEPTA